EEAGKAVIRLWHKGKISASELWIFAYNDINRLNYPMAIETATIYRKLTKHIWLRKYNIITETYGFAKNSFEAETTPRAESFWKFTDHYDAQNWFKQFENLK
ncbi:MAG: PIG-L family deacetylase, partial [Anaerolineaceae bacterium]|nr:PIG-L family deacetylase [Anaerolineaceae bacterium]